MKYLKYMVTFFIMILIFLLFLFLSTLINKDDIYNNMKKSAEILCEEYQNSLRKVANIKTDNYTEALMLNIVYSMDSRDIVGSILLGRKNFCYDLNQQKIEDSVGELESSAIYDFGKSADQIRRIYILYR